MNSLISIPDLTLPWRVRDGRPLRRDMDILRRLLIAIAEGRAFDVITALCIATGKQATRINS